MTSRSNGGQAFVRSAFAPQPHGQHDDEDDSDVTEKPSTTFIPYVAGVSERIRKVRRDYTSEQGSSLGPPSAIFSLKVKDPLPMMKQSNVVYEVPCTCSKVYIGKTKQRLGTRLKEHKDACIKCLMDKSAIAKHAWTNDHPINWAAQEFYNELVEPWSWS